MVSRRRAELHVYDPATMLCRTCRYPWVCDDGKKRLLEEFRHCDPQHLQTVLAETAAFAVRVLGATTPEEIAAVHYLIREWLPAERRCD